MYHKILIFFNIYNKSYFSENINDGYLGTEGVGIIDFSMAPPKI